MSKIKFKNESFIHSFLNLKIVVLLSNVVFQGMRYMSLGERFYKLSITVIFAFLVDIFIKNLIISFIVAHLLNYIVNGQFYVVFRYLSSKRTMSERDLIQFVDIINHAIKIFKPNDVLVIGSFCKGRMSKSSDLDIRLFHDENPISSISAYFMASYLRFMGLFLKFPIDIFCFSDLKFLDKISPKEIPVNFLENERFLNKYPSSINYSHQLNKLIIT